VPELDARKKEFAALNAQVMDISVDSIPSHIAWREKEVGAVEVPLCSDFYPHAEVTRKFGMLREGPPVAGISERAVFVVERQARSLLLRFIQLTSCRILRSCWGRCEGLLRTSDSTSG